MLKTTEVTDANGYYVHCTYRQSMPIENQLKHKQDIMPHIGLVHNAQMTDIVSYG